MEGDQGRSRIAERFAGGGGSGATPPPVRLPEAAPPPPPPPAEPTPAWPHVTATVVAAVLFTLLYDPFGFTVLAFLALAPVVLVFANPAMPCSPLRAAACGFGFGLLASLGIVGPWMFSAAVGYFERGIAWSAAFTLGVNALYVALFHMPAFLAIRALAGAPPFLRMVGAASAWILFECWRASWPAGNSWALLGQAFATLPMLREAAAWGGVPFLGWMAALFGSATGVALQPDLRSRDSLVSAVTALLVPVVLAGLGVAARPATTDVAPLRPLKVAVVQAEVPARDVWNPASRMKHWDDYFVLTSQLRPGSADLVVWPESAAAFLLGSDAAAKARVAELATSTGAAILLGGPRSGPAVDGRAPLFNSAYFFTPGRPEPANYDKRRLLPWIEGGPAVDLGDPEGLEYSAGSEAVLFDVKGWKVSPLICFEAVYADLAAEAVARGAHVLVNLSNDAWFAGGSGPEQHYQMSRLRSPELRRPMVRASNGGISGAIAADGSEIGFPIRRQRSVRVYEVPPPPRAGTLAMTSGHWVAVVSLSLLLAALASTAIPGLRR